MSLERYRQRLGVSAGATRRELDRAYRRRAMATHPDKGGTARAFHEVREAYLALSDPQGEREVRETGLAPTNGARLDFGSLPVGAIAWGAAIVEGAMGGGTVRVRPLAGAWWRLADAVHLDPDHTRAALVFVAEPHVSGAFSDRVAVDVGGRTASIELRVRSEHDQTPEPSGA